LKSIYSENIKRDHIMTGNLAFLDFKVVREFWDVYDLNDGTKLKNRVILTGVKKINSNSIIIGNNGKNNKSGEYEFDFQSIQSFIFSEKSKGNPHTNFYKKEELDASYKIEVPYSVISEKWNEYTVKDDGTSLKLKSTVTDVKKSNIFLQNGDPIYNVRIKILSKVIRPII
jgi:hypothetical protein